ncbi:MAG TPA: hypothetical protein VEK11_21855 [Thermoanaerobaculia bacterium]|nr:hypothetical protein [Thermoanaerobaculia bacterium]
MTFGAAILLLAGALLTEARGGGFVLGGEAVQFDAELRPQFSERQVLASAASTRAGFARWASTAEGKTIIRRFLEPGREVRIVESNDERGLGRAPQPGFATLLAAGDPKTLKVYVVILNPALADEYRGSRTPALGWPRTPAEAMSVAWAAEMLHVDFYANGVQLPHHDRNDFQRRWRAVVNALGLPRVEHGTVE